MPRFKRARKLLRSGHNPDTTTPAKRSSDPTRLSPSALCNICAHGLRLDDRRAGGALQKPRNDGAPSLYFPDLGKEPAFGWGGIVDWKGGAQYKQRDITPPHLLELSDECKFCHIVKRMLLEQLGRHEWWQTTTTKLRLEVQYEWRGHETIGLPEFELKTLEVKVKRLEHGYCCKISFPIATSSGLCQKWLHIEGRPLDVESSFSERNVDLIRSWLKQCQTDTDGILPLVCKRLSLKLNQAGPLRPLASRLLDCLVSCLRLLRAPTDADSDSSCCLSAKREKFLPTRLLDVGTQGSTDLPITLVDTRSMDQLRYEDRPLKYICLSYCWGAGQPPLRTTKSTIEGHKAGIPIDSMPRLFRDAVLVARTLGIRYLWIDALCIIQGCYGDWHMESAQMAQVFSHSWMTIGAAAASSCHETLFHPRQDVSINIEFQSSLAQHVKGTISILLLNGAWNGPFQVDMRNSKWNTRGWVLQEQKLSPRLLVFGEKMLHFKCHQRMLYESQRHTNPAFEIPEVCLDRPRDWREVMHVYSRRQFTNGSDRLAAISGLAKAISQELKHKGESATYIAGIWLAENTDMYSQLSWSLGTPTISFGQLLRYHSDPQQYIAPSWSWAALNQPVNYLRMISKPVFRVVTHNIRPARSDPTVAIAPGSSITLLGKLREIPGRPSKGTKSVIETQWSNCTCWNAPYSDFGKRIAYYLNWDPCTQEFTEGDAETHLKLFLLSKIRNKAAFGLILFPDVVDPKVFLRVGSFEIRWSSRSPDWNRKLADWEGESPDWKETEVVII